jgi:hypothetical protein
MGINTIDCQSIYSHLNKDIGMSKREQEKAIEDTKKVAEQAIKSVENTAQQFQNTFHRSLDETKENVRKSIDEAKTQIPRYADVVKNYQEQALELTGRMVEDYINTQKSIMDSVFSSAAPYYENVSRMYNHWLSPKVPTELYTGTVSNIAENISASTRIGNDILFGNIDTWRNAFEQAQRHTQELSKINTNMTKVIGETAAELSVRQREV